MIRRSPCEYYIRYLLIRPDHYSDDDVVKVLREHHLDYPGGSYLSRLRSAINPPRPFYPADEGHTPSWRFLLRERVYHLFHPDDPMKAALSILHDPRTKEAVEAMILVGDPPALICHRMQSWGLSLTPQALRRYQHYFWNIKLVDSTEMRALLSVRVDDMVLDGEGAENTIRAKAMKRASYMDPRWIAANSPVKEMAALLTQMRFGYMPDRIDLSRLVISAASAAATRASEELLSGHPDAAARARDFTSVLQGMYGMLEHIGSPDEELKKDLLLLGLKTEEVGVPTIEVVTEGHYTSDMQLLTEGEREGMKDA